jgi:hypothetical protein
MYSYGDLVSHNFSRLTGRACKPVLYLFLETFMTYNRKTILLAGGGIDSAALMAFAVPVANVN